MNLGGPLAEFPHHPQPIGRSHEHHSPNHPPVRQFIHQTLPTIPTTRRGGGGAEDRLDKAARPLRVRAAQSVGDQHRVLRPIARERCPRHPTPIRSTRIWSYRVLCVIVYHNSYIRPRLPPFVPLGPHSARHRLQQVVTQVRSKTFPYVRRPRRRIPWRLYTRAQTRELPEMLDLIRDLVDLYALEHPEPPTPHPRGGRPAIPLSDRLKGLLAQSYLGLPNRPTEGEVAAFRAALGIGSLFGYKTVERSYGDPRMGAALYALLEITNRPVHGLETGFAADGTGSPIAVGQHYRSARARQAETERQAGLLPQGERGWVYNVGAVGVRYGLIAGWVSWTNRRVGEVSQFSELTRQTKELHPEWSKFFGDGAYSARWVVGLLDRMGVRSWILPRRNVTLKRLGEPAWPRSLLGLVRDPQAWLSEYHQRSRSEATWWSIGARNPGKIRKRIANRRETEALLRAVVRNLRRLCYLRWLERDGKFTAFRPLAS